MNHMNAQLLVGHGGVEQYSFTRVPIPIPKADQVLIRVSACGVNNVSPFCFIFLSIHETLGQTDIWTREGRYGQGDSQGWTPLTFPRIQGADICGTISQVGENVCVSRIGQRVIVYPAILGPNGIVDCAYVGSEVSRWEKTLLVKAHGCRLMVVSLSTVCCHHKMPF